jgi:hypothetical protein
MKTPEYYGITKYDKEKFEKTKVLDVHCSVNLSSFNLAQIPFQFGVVEGYFNCSRNSLTSLKGAPSKVNGDFNCSENQLTTLEGCPIEVKDLFDCSWNNLITLDHGPNKVGHSYDCSNNKLTSLKGCVLLIESDYNCSKNQIPHIPFFDCSRNNLSTSEFFPKVSGTINLENNNFSLNAWIELLQKYDYTYCQCQIVPNNSSLNETIQGLKDKLEIIQMMSK